MEIYNGTGKTKTGILRITKSIGAILLTSSQNYAAFLNEKITAHIERTNGDNEEIATNIPLKAFMAMSVFGEGKIIQGVDSETSVYLELADNGAIGLGENESIIIQFTDLESFVTYAIYGIEMPVIASSTLFMTEKVMLAGQKQRNFEVEPFDEGVLIGDFEKVKLSYVTETGTRTIELTKLELRAITADIGLIREGSDTQIDDTLVSLVGVVKIEIFSANQVNLILRDING